MLCTRHGLPADRCPACAARRRLDRRTDIYTNTVEDAARFEQHRGPDPVGRQINGRFVEDPPGPDEL